MQSSQSKSDHPEYWKLFEDAISVPCCYEHCKIILRENQHIKSMNQKLIEKLI